MPSPSSNSLQLGAVPLSQIKKFIPKSWLQQPNHSTRNNQRSPTKPTTATLPIILLDSPSPDSSMLETLFASLKDSISSKGGRLPKALTIFSLIQHHSRATANDNANNVNAPCSILVQSLSSLLVSCTRVKSLPLGKQLHSRTLALGLDRHPVLVPKLITFYSAFDLLIDAHVVTRTSNVVHPLPWNLLISSYVRVGFTEKALSAYKEMVGNGIQPDEFTYPSVLKACSEELDLDFGKETHKCIDTGQFRGNLFVQNALISMYGKCGELGVARMVFDNMPERDSVSWSSIISEYSSRGMWTEAFELFERMRGECDGINIITWNTMAGGCLKTGNYMGALLLLSHMRSNGVILDHVAVITGLSACSHIYGLRLGKEIHGIAVRNGCHTFDNVNNALITMYSRCKDIRHAYIVFHLVEDRTVICWNSIISGYTHLDRYEEASFLFRKMLVSRIKPNYVTIASILPLCARVANLQHGKEFHCYIVKHEVLTDHLLVWNSLVEMYARSGKISVARRLFDLLTKKDKVTYTSLMAGYGVQGEGKITLDLFEEMIRVGIEPDHVTLTSVLSACSHSGLVIQGQALFEKMSTVYGVIPRLEHFSCMVDLFGRAGLLRKAIEVVRSMPYQPTPAMWATIVGGCRIHGNMELGEWAAEKLLEMQPQHSGYYVLVANMYAAAGSWHKLAMVRTFMRDLGVKKDPGCAWLDVGAGFSPFLVEDTSNTKTDEIYPLLGGLSKQLKVADHHVEDICWDNHM